MLKKPSRKKGAGPKPDAAVAAMFAKVIDAINTQDVRLENLRVLLVKRGVFSDAEFDAELVETQRLWTQRYSEMIAKAVADGTVLMQQRLLRSHKGKLQ